MARADVLLPARLPARLLLAGAADVVVLGMVRSTRVDREADGRTFTVVEVAPTEVLKGTTPPGAVVVRQLGGLTAGGGSVVAGSAVFAPDECVLLFLRRAGGELRLVGEAQGKFSVSRDPGAATWTASRVESTSLASTWSPPKAPQNSASEILAAPHRS